MHDIDLVIQLVSCLSAICERLLVSLGDTSVKCVAILGVASLL